MVPKLAILIPTLPERQEKFDLLVNELIRQTIEAGYVYRRDVKVIYDPAPRGEKSTGAKRNYLIEQALKLGAEYVSEVDDDDWVSPDYIHHTMKGIESGMDCCSLRGIITWDGKNPEVFEHSVRYSEWKTNDTGAIKYERGITPLNCVKTKIAAQIKFPDITFGEDHSWSKAIMESGLIKTEYYIDKPIYKYLYVTRK